MKNYKTGIIRKVKQRKLPVWPEVVTGRDYLYAIGRRKRAVARVRLYKNGKGQVFVNGKEHLKYFSTGELRDTAIAAMVAVGQADKVDVSVLVLGGGPKGQALATRLGISRALLKLNPL
ncbi:MAG: 30S ribosomal protein S9, partial [bacterium]